MDISVGQNGRIIFINNFRQQNSLLLERKNTMPADWQFYSDGDRVALYLNNKNDDRAEKGDERTPVSGSSFRILLLFSTTQKLSVRHFTGRGFRRRHHSVSGSGDYRPKGYRIVGN